VYGGVLAAILLLSLSPLPLAGWPMPLAAPFQLLPPTMVHRYEEHDQERLRLFFNETIGKGFDVLSPLAVSITNGSGVWLSLGWAFIAVYLVLVHTVVHIVPAVLFRRYNPGLVTALVEGQAPFTPSV
jgi:hypothetical protein